MNRVQERQLNQAAYRQLCDSIKQTYPLGRFVAISGGQIVADAEGFKELRAVLDSRRIDATEVLIVQAGVDYLEPVIIFSQGE